MVRRWPFWLMIVLVAASILQGCSTPVDPPQRERVTLRFGYRQNIADYLTLAQEYQRVHPHVTIDLVPIEPFRSPGGLQVPDLIDQEEIDVLRWSTDYLTAEWGSEVLPLDEMMLADRTFPHDDIFMGAMEALESEGKQLGVPAGLDPLVAYCNEGHFAGAEQDLPGLGWTMEEFLASVVSVDRTGVEVADPSFAYGFCSQPESMDPIIITYIMGGSLFDRLDAPTRVTLDLPANIEAMRLYADLRLRLGVMPDPRELGGGSRWGVFGLIANGKCGVWLGEYQDRNGLLWGREWSGKAVMLPLPRGDVPVDFVAMDGYYILAQSRHSEEAWNWIRFLLDYEEAAGMLMPPRRSQVDSEGYARRVGHQVAEVARQLPDIIEVVGILEDPVVSEVVGLYLEAAAQVVTGNADAETALREAQKTAQALFAAHQ